jgi:hypothetical protein
MQEPTGTDVDDATERQAQARQGILRDEVSTRALNYHRALTALRDQLNETLALVNNPAVDLPIQQPPLPHRQWRAVREAETMMDAALQALREHRAKQ